MKRTEEEIKAERSARVVRVVERLRKGRRFRLAKQLYPSWTPEELELCKPFGDRIRLKEISYYRATIELTKLLPGRTYEAIRKKLKNWVAYGDFNQSAK